MKITYPVPFTVHLAVMAVLTAVIALIFSTFAHAYSGEDYIKSLEYKDVDAHQNLTKEERKRLLNHISWIHFPMSNVLPKYGNIDDVQSYARTQDALPIIMSSEFSKKALETLSAQPMSQKLLLDLKADGLFSVEDALLFSRSAAKALHLP